MYIPLKNMYNLYVKVKAMLVALTDKIDASVV